MYKLLQLVLLVLALVTGVVTVDAQSTYKYAIEYYSARKYPQAIEEFRNSLDYFKSEETPQLDSIALVYENMQLCFMNKMKIDSSLQILKEAETFFLNKKYYKKYVEFKMAGAELKLMVGTDQDPIIVFEDLLKFEHITNGDKLRCYLRLSNQYLGIPNEEKAYFAIKESLRLAELEKDSSILGNVYETYAGIENFFGNDQKSVDLYLHAIPFLQKYKKNFVLAGVYRKLGFIFYNADNYEKAKEYTILGYDIAKKNGIQREEVITRSFIAKMQLHEGKIEEAIKGLTSTLKFFSSRRMYNHLVDVKGYLMVAHQANGDLEKAKDYQKSSEEDFERASRFGFKLKYHKNSLLYFIGLKNKRKARYHLNGIKTLLENSNDVGQIYRYHWLKSRYERAFGNLEQALRDIDIYLALRDSSEFEIQKKNIHDLEGKYKKNEQDKEIALLNSENELKASRLSKQRQAIFGGLIALFIFGFLSAFIYRLYKKVHSQNAVIKSALSEKDTLLREIHHRVKNNLQVISSLLALQSRYIIDEKALSALKEGQDRVHSMALIHQDLYENNDLTGVNTQMYLEQLVENLFDSYNIDEDRISYVIDVEEIILDVDTMIPLGLIINELVSNSLKHAFEEGALGEISVSLKEREKKLYLQVRDDGKGVSSIKDIEGQSFGFELIKAFTTKLKAEMNVTSEEGLNIEIVVNRYKKAS